MHMAAHGTPLLSRRFLTVFQGLERNMKLLALDEWVLISSPAADSTVHIEILTEPFTCPPLQAAVYHSQTDVFPAPIHVPESTSPYLQGECFQRRLTGRTLKVGAAILCERNKRNGSWVGTHVSWLPFCCDVSCPIMSSLMDREKPPSHEWTH